MDGNTSQKISDPLPTLQISFKKKKKKVVLTLFCIPQVQRGCVSILNMGKGSYPQAIRPIMTSFAMARNEAMYRRRGWAGKFSPSIRRSG